MAIRTYKVTLDTKNSIAPEPVLLRQGDKTGAVVIDATLMDNGVPVSLNGLTPVFKANTADGKAVIADSTGFNIISASDGEFTYQVPSQLGSVPGKINIAYFSFTDSSGNQSTFDIVFAVSPSVDMTQESAKDWVSNLDETINKYNQWVNNAHSSWQDFVNANKEIIESIDPGGTLLTEVINARTPSGADAYPALGDRLDAGVDARSKNAKAFGVKGDGSTDDLAAINSMIANAADGDTFFFPSGNYVLSNSIVISKKINLAGVKPIYDSGDLTEGTVLRGGGIYFKTGSSGSKVSGIGVVTGANIANGFDIHGVIDSITIENCLTIARDHGYLIESYNGLVQNVKVLNCEAHDGIHGFISKASRTTFEDCLASGLQYWGYGIITDNILAADEVGSAINNKVVNCRAVKCGVGFSQYKRNYFGTGENKVPCLGNQFIACTSESCNNSLSIGDTPGETGNGKYVTYPVDNTIISAFTEIFPSSSTRILFSRNLAISGIVLDKKADLSNDATHNNPGLTVSGVSGAKLGTWFDIQLLSTGDNPSVKYGRFFRTANTTSTVITQLANIVDGQTYTIALWDDQTRIQQSTMIKLQGGTVYGRGNSIQLRAQDGALFELARTMSANSAMQVNYAHVSGFDIGLFDYIEIIAGNADNVSNLIKINNADARNAIVTILIRSVSGAIKPAGFDPSEFVIPTDNDLVKFTHSIDFGTGLMTQWAYTPSIGKYVLISSQLVPYV
ncbi:BppU family phage baseplate upper protein [Lacticaseibacillus paracasei]|uniref:BppU family phage baseplate upper protein n=1 Tax=Lacticaseibacillus paracasei TaxID=1597 RepID=UPI00235F2AD4|nr:BppU family phage baseplate upper protein [Lacticaseibacillus paracasei]